MKNDNNNSAVNGVVSYATAKSINDQQFSKYHTKQGHGFSAEDANALSDQLRGRRVEKVGLNNAKNGADRIVNGIQIQTKYCKTACETVSAAFNNGHYRYPGMKLEVPADQYSNAVRLMSKRIAEGQVPGVTDPNMANQIVVKGKYTYSESVKIAKAGKIDSIKFDAKTQVVSCGIACGLSFTVNYLTAKSNGNSHKEAMKYASKEAAKAGGVTLITGVTAKQLLRTSVGRNFSALVTKCAKHAIDQAWKSPTGKKIITKLGSGAAGKAIGGAAAKNAFAKAASSNAVTGTVVLIGTAIPDVYKLCQGKISGREFAENTTCNAAGIGGGWAGATTGAAIGTCICPGIGTAVGGFIGGMIGGISGTAVTKKIFSCFKSKKK